LNSVTSIFIDGDNIQPFLSDLRDHLEVSDYFNVKKNNGNYFIQDIKKYTLTPEGIWINGLLFKLKGFKRLKRYPAPRHISFWVAKDYLQVSIRTICNHSFFYNSLHKVSFECFTESFPDVKTFMNPVYIKELKLKKNNRKPQKKSSIC
jgi:hypothetical protein